jgi:hypothetical protein
MSIDLNNKNPVKHKSNRKYSDNSDQSPDVSNKLFVKDFKRMNNSISVSSEVKKKNLM